jgi:hypothetical protein
MARSSLSSDETRAATTPAEPAQDKIAEASTHGPTRHEDLDFFDKAGHEELSRRLSRTQSRLSTHTQDPAAADFDYEQHLKHILRKGEKNGVLRRDLGVAFQDLKVAGDGSGLAYGPTVGEIVTGVTRIGAAIKAARHPTRKNILVGFTGTVKPKEMLLVLGR